MRAQDPSRQWVSARFAREFYRCNRGGGGVSSARRRAGNGSDCGVLPRLVAPPFCVCPVFPRRPGSGVSVRSLGELAPCTDCAGQRWEPRFHVGVGGYLRCGQCGRLRVMPRALEKQLRRMGWLTGKGKAA